MVGALCGSFPERSEKARLTSTWHSRVASQQTVKNASRSTQDATIEAHCALATYRASRRVWRAGDAL